MIPDRGSSWSGSARFAAVVFAGISVLAVHLAGAAQTQEQPLPRAAVAAALQERFSRVDDFELSEYPSGARGQFSIVGDLRRRNAPVVSQSRGRDASREALAEVIALLRIDQTEFTGSPRSETTDELGITHGRYQFSFRGVPVEGFEVLTHVSKDGVLTSASGNVVRFSAAQLESLRNLVGRTAITANQAEATARAGVRGKVAGAPKVGAIITETAPHLFWTVEIVTREPLGAWRLYVAAETGAIARRVNLAIR